MALGTLTERESLMEAWRGGEARWETLQQI